jgi:hypothetical protein
MSVSNISINAALNADLIMSRYEKQNSQKRRKVLVLLDRYAKIDELLIRKTIHEMKKTPELDYRVKNNKHC